MIPNLGLNVLGKKIAWSTVVQYGGKIGQLVFSAMTIKLITNFLTQNHYGTYAAVMEYALFFSVAANLGIFGNIVRKMADDPLNRHVFLNALYLRIATALIFFSAGMGYLLWSGRSPVVIIASSLFFGTLFFDFISSVCNGFLQANYLMGRATIAMIVGRALNTGFVFWVTHYTIESAQTVSILFGAQLIDGVISMALVFGFVWYQLRSVPKAVHTHQSTLRDVIDIPLMKTLFLTSLPFGLINILNNLYFHFLPVYFVHESLTNAQFGTFDISFRIAQNLAFFSTPIVFSVLPGFKQFLDGKHFDKARVLYSKVWKILLLAGVGLVVGGSLLGPWAIATLTHSKYLIADFWFVLPMMLILAAISYGYDLVLITLFAMEQDLWFLKRELLALGLAGAVFTSIFFIPNPLLKLAVIIAGAIVGESTMVVLGIVKIRKQLLS